MRGSWGMRLSTGLTCVLGAVAGADVRLPTLLGDHMVVQRNAEATIWGWADAGERITVTADWPGARRVEVTAGPDGSWRASVPTGNAGGAHTVEIKGKNTITLRDVVLGEVWVCSGQSNMEWPLSATEGAAEEAAKSNLPNIRLFTVTNRYSLDEERDVAGAWALCTPETANSFSAVGLYFGKELSRELNVPIGLISADWGGTPAEAWMPEDDVARHGGFEQLLALMTELRRDPMALKAAGESAQATWWASAATGDGAWVAPGFDDTSWGTLELPSSWAGDLAWFDGMVMFRRSVDVPAAWAGKDLVLSLGPIDDQDTAWFNGERVGGTTEDGYWNQARAYTIPGRLVTAGANTIALAVLDTGGIGGANGKAEEMHLALAAGGASVPVAGPWKFKAGKKANELPPRPQLPRFGPNWPSGLYNGMIAPLTPMRIAGAIWYQGESNVGRWQQYRTLFPALIGAWRSAFGREIPFGLVQIAPFAYQGDTGQTALLREAQAMALRLPGTGMAVTMDIGNPRDIHPTNKRDVGKRLSLWALAKVYGKKDVVFSGPRYKAMAVEGSSARVVFDDAKGLRTRDGDAPSHFWIAGDDKVFHHAQVEIKGENLIVSSPDVAKPAAVRYGWSAAAEPNLENGAGLPAAPFRTDAWDDAAPPAENAATSHLTDEPGFVELFNGSDLTGWVNVNGDDSTWKARDGMIVCSGVPTGVLRTEQQYENFVLEMEWKHLESPGNAGLFVWSDPLTARGQPFTRSVEVQVMVGAEGDWYTSDGDIFPIHGAVMTPVNGRGGSRAFPTEKRMLPAGEWNHYRVTCFEGSISLAVNGKVVTTGHAISPRKGYICLESEGTPIHFRNIRIKEILPSRNNPVGPEDSAASDEGFTSLYNGVNFEGWKFGPEHEGHWRADDWTISFDGEGADLWTEKSYKDFVLIADWRWVNPGTPVQRPVILPSGEVEKDAAGNDVMREVIEAGDSGIYLRGSSKSQVNIWCWPCGSGEVYGYRTDAAMPPEVKAGVTPSEVADAPIGEWNRFVITMKGDRLTVVLNGKTVLENAHLPGVAAEGALALQMHHAPIQFANLYIRELKATE